MPHMPTQLHPHPYLLNWGLGRISLVRLAQPPHDDAGIYVPREQAPDVSQRVYDILQAAPPRVVVGVDLRGIALMPSLLWRQLGPLLQARTLDGEFGSDKRLLYLTGGDDELLRMLTWAFRDASQDASSRGAGKRVDRAALTPAAESGYCGVLRDPYAEVLQFVNSRGVASNEDVHVHVDGRYSLNNANNYLTALADLGLIFRRLMPREGGGYASLAYALTVPEEVMADALDLV